MNAPQSPRRRRYEQARKGPETSAAPASMAEALPLQQALGNRAVGRLLGSQSGAAAGGGLEGLMLGADMLNTLQASMGNLFVQRLVAPKESTVTEDEAQTLQQVERAQAGGSPLPEATRAEMEGAVGHDLGDVRVHTDVSADNLSKQLNARAFTTGRDIFFRSGAYDPDSQAGKETLAHELTHVAQQAGAGTAPSRAISDPSDPSEQEAEAVAHGLAQPVSRRAAPSAAIHRAPPPTTTDEDKKTTNFTPNDPNASTSTPTSSGNGIDTTTPGASTQNSSPGTPTSTPTSTPGTGTNDVPTSPGGGFIGPPLPDQPGPVKIPDVTPASGDPGGNGGGNGTGGTGGAGGNGAGNGNGGGTSDIDNPPSSNGGGGGGGGQPSSGGGGPGTPRIPLAPDQPGTPTPQTPGNPEPVDPSTPGGQSKEPNKSFDPNQGGSSQQPPEPPTRQKPQSSADWHALHDQFQSDINGARMIMEVLRPVPFIGLITGGAADLMVFAEDLDAVSDEDDATGTKFLIVLRDVINLLNNALGSIASTDILLQDLLTSTGVLAEGDAITAPIEVGVKQVKLGLDVAETVMEILVLAGAIQHRAHATSEASAAAWDSIITSYESNLIGDIINGIFDAIDLATAGAAQAGPVGDAGKWVKRVLIDNKLYAAIRSIILGWYGIYGSGKGLVPDLGSAPAPISNPEPAAPPAALPTPPAGVPAVNKLGADDVAAPGTGPITDAEKQVAAAIIRTELQGMRDVYNDMDTALTIGSQLMGMAMENQRQQLQEFLGGKDPVKLFVQGMHEALDKMNAEVSNVVQFQEYAGTAKDKADALKEMAAAALASIESIKVPSLTLPTSGDGGVLDEAAKLLQEQVLNRVTSQVTSMLNDVKSTIESPVRSLQTHADEIAEYATNVQQTSVKTVKMLQTRIDHFSQAIAKCNSLEDIVNTVIAQIFENLGLGAGFTIDDVVKEWKAIGPLLDEADAWVAQMAQPTGKGGGGSTADDGGAPSPVMAAPPPSDATP